MKKRVCTYIYRGLLVPLFGAFVLVGAEIDVTQKYPFSDPDKILFGIADNGEVVSPYSTASILSIPENIKVEIEVGAFVKLHDHALQRSEEVATELAKPVYKGRLHTQTTYTQNHDYTHKLLKVKRGRLQAMSCTGVGDRMRMQARDLMHLLQWSYGIRRTVWTSVTGKSADFVIYVLFKGNNNDTPSLSNDMVSMKATPLLKAFLLQYSAHEQYKKNRWADTPF